jgi:uncharacterized DUF497 family protein
LTQTCLLSVRVAAGRRSPKRPNGPKAAENGKEGRHVWKVHPANAAAPPLWERTGGWSDKPLDSKPVCTYNVHIWGIMRFEWREAKRQRNIAERGVDFIALADLAFDGRPRLTYDSPRETVRGVEMRHVSVVEIEGQFYALVWTWRGENIRIISARRARHAEEQRYRELHG